MQHSGGSAREWPPLDLDKLAKVKGLHDRSENAGERASALAAMMRIARKAGMSISAALSKLDAEEARKAQEASAVAAFSKAMADFDNTPEQREFRAKREAEREARRREALDEYGSEAVLFEENVYERRLRIACEPLIERRPVINGHISTLAGWRGYGCRNMPASVREAVSTAYRLPRTVAEAWDEWEFWEGLLDQRCAFDRNYDASDEVNARRAVVELLLDTLPADSADDVMARIAWLKAVIESECPRDVNENGPLVDRLAADVARMAGIVTGGDPVPSVEPEHQAGFEGSAAGVQVGQPLNRAQKREAVRILFAEGLSDREIARRVGVSPSTVGAVRRESVA